MTFAELDADLPNGLRDAALRELRYEPAAERLTLEIEICVGDPEALTAQGRDVVRLASLVFHRVSGLTIERPEGRRPPEKAGQPEWVSGKQDPTLVPVSEGVPDPSLEGVSLFRHETNSFVRFVTGRVELEWLEEEPGYR